MDLIAACRVFVAVSGAGSFTVGAAAAGVPQSVASRRVSALEEHLGGRLLSRSSRAVTLTAFGRELLPVTRRLLELADALADDAERARRRPFRLAVPAICPPRALAVLAAEARRAGLHLEFHPGGPAERAELSRRVESGAALLAVPPAEAAWRVPLGIAAHDEPDVPVVHLETLRPGRSTGRARRVWLQPEDDVPHIRDPLARLAAAVGLRPAQIVVAGSLVAAAAETLGGDDLLVCAAAQAGELGLRWRPLGGLDLARGYDVAATGPDEARRLRSLLHAEIDRCLGET